MTASSASPATDNPEVYALPNEVEPPRAGAWLLRPIEWVSAALMVVIVSLLLSGVTSRYVFSAPLVWVDEAVSIAFLWLAMLGSAIAIHRNEHLRLTVFLQMLPLRWQGPVQAFGLGVVALFLGAMAGPALEYIESESFVTTPALEIPNSWRVAAIAVGIFAMGAVVLGHAWLVRHAGHASHGIPRLRCRPRLARC